MARLAKDHTERRNQILAAAQQLVYTRGYDQMTIQDILDKLHISKGAFYHYFSSKQDLLEAIIGQMQVEVEEFLTAIVEDPQLPALEKLQRFISMAVRWKTDRKAFLFTLLQVWYADENALVRQKVQATLQAATKPMLSAMIYQGIEEGIFDTPYPEQAGEIVLVVLQGVGETFARRLLAKEFHNGDLVQLTSSVAAYADALERILGAPRGSIELIDEVSIREWTAIQTG